MAGSRHISKSRSQIDYRTAGSIYPSGSALSFKPRGTDESGPRTQAHMDGERRLVGVLIELVCGGKQRKRGIDRSRRMLQAVSIVENRQEAISGSLIHIATGFTNAIEKDREVALDYFIERGQRQSFTQSSVASGSRSLNRV